MAVKAGDRILFGKWSGSEVRIEGEDLLIMKESDILGIIQRRHGGPEGGLIPVGDHFRDTQEHVRWPSSS